MKFFRIMKYIILILLVGFTILLNWGQGYLARQDIIYSDRLILIKIVLTWLIVPFALVISYGSFMSRRLGDSRAITAVFISNGIIIFVISIAFAVRLLIYSFGEITAGTAYSSDITVTAEEDTPVVNYAAGGEWYGQTVGYDYPSYGGIFDAGLFDLFYKDIFMVQKLLAAIYILGFIVVAGILGLQKYRYLKRLQGGLLIEHNETINTILRDMGMGHVLVFSSDEIASPMVCGLLNPHIYLPTQMEFQNTTQLRHVLSHETMHIRRKDN